MNIFEYLKNNTYPGRGIIVGMHDNKKVIAYFIMGRSENSRNRVFRKDDDTIYTKAFDESKVEDPSLIIYNCIRTFESKTIVTNGNQTDTIYDYLKDGKTFKDALDTRVYEPDAPSYTPRISWLLDDDKYLLNILKKKDEECLRLYYEYPYINNKGHFISTYDHDGNPLPSYSKKPIEVEIDLDINDFSNELWNSLNEDNKISLYVRYYDEDNYKDVLINKKELVWKSLN